MSDWPIGISTGCFYESSILDILEVVRDGGFTSIEVCSFPKHLDYHDRDKVSQAAKRIQEVGLEPFSFHAPFADHIDITALDETPRKRSIQELVTAAEAAAELGVRHLVLHPVPRDRGKTARRGVLRAPRKRRSSDRSGRRPMPRTRALAVA